MSMKPSKDNVIPLRRRHDDYPEYPDYTEWQAEHERASKLRAEELEWIESFLKS